MRIMLNSWHMKHFLDDPLSDTDPQYDSKLDEDGVIHQWLLESLYLDINGDFLHLNLTSKFWECALENKLMVLCMI